MEALQQPSLIRDKAAIVAWMRAEVARILDLSPGEIDTRVSLLSYGLDSSAAIAVTETLSKWLGRDVNPALLLDHPTIEGLAAAVDKKSR